MSLLEILISIGIIAVGLFGLAALLPLAGKQATQGVREDRAAAVGRRAFREFMISGYANRSTYWIVDGTNDLTDSVSTKPVCLDPIQAAVYSSKNSGAQNLRGVVTFPSVGLTSLGESLQVLSFRARPGVAGMMPLSQAMQVCSSHDELVVKVDDKDHSAPAVTQNISDSSGALKRDDAQDFTWFATVSNVRDLRAILAIVVVYKRDLTFTTNANTGDQRVVPVVYPYGGSTSISGGEVFIFGATADQLEVKNGWWVMLISTRSDGARHYRWFRVANAGEVRDIRNDSTPPTGLTPNVPATGTYPFYRTLTLQGGDFPRGDLAGTYDKCVLVRGAMAVYEKTMRIENNSLYTAP